MSDRLIERFFQIAQRYPEKVALITDRSQMSYKDLLDLTHVLDIQLKNRGIREGQTIVLESQRGELCIAFALLLSLRSLDVIFASGEMVARRGIAFDRIVTAEPIDGIPAERQIVMDAEWFTMMGSIPHPRYESLPGHGGAFLTPTSGTTGEPKLVRMPEASRLHDLQAMNVIPPESMPSVRFMTTSGQNTGWAMNKNLAVLLGGGSVVSLGTDSSRMLSYCDLWHVSHLAVTPSVLQQALDLPNAAQYMTSLQEIEVGGAFAPPGLLSRTREMCRADIITSYGATEIGALCRRRHGDDRAERDGAYLGEVFRDDLEVLLLDDQLAEASGAEEGVLAVRIPESAPRAYLPDAHDTPDEETGLSGARFVTGDLVRRDGNHLYLEGRRKRVFNFNGNKYSLDRIQTALLQELPPGTEIAAVASKRPDELEQLVVYYVSDTEFTTAQLDDVLRRYWKKIRLGAAVRVPQMPMTASGKIDMRALAAIPA